MSLERQSQKRKYLNATASVCARCHRVVNGQIFERDDRVYMRKFCPEHGHEEVLMSGDSSWYHRASSIRYTPQYPFQFTAKVQAGCPEDCGICGDHQQRCMIPVLEITDHCNMSCPICFAYNQGRYHMSMEELDRCLDTIQRSERGEVDLLVVSGGEPTVHPEFLDLMARVRARGFKHVMVNTNGIRLAQDLEFCGRARELGLQFTLWIDGFTERTQEALRGQDTRQVKTRALENLGRHGIHTTILMVVAPGINEGEVGDVLRLGMSLDFVRGVTFHTLAYSGKGGSGFPRVSGEVITAPDIMKLIEKQSGFLGVSDFSPVPAPHPLCESTTYLLLSGDGGDPVPLPRIVDRARYLQMVENNAILRADDRLQERLEEMITDIYTREPRIPDADRALGMLKELLIACYPPAGGVTQEMRERICERAIKAVFIVPYMDAHNLDLTRLRSCISMQVVPDGRLIPSCAYHTLYRSQDPRFFPGGPAKPPS